MTSWAKKALSAFIGATMVATPLNACAAEDSVASEANTEATNENVSSAPSMQATKLSVQFVGVQDQTINDARIVAAAASNSKIAIIVWGGNRTIQQEAYNAALDLIDMGIPVAFVLAPDTNGLEGDASFQIYARSEPRFDGSVGVDNASDLRPVIRQAGLDAHKEVFPQQVATLSIR